MLHAILVPGINLQIQLHTIRDAIITQGDVVFEWPLTLSLQDDLARVTTDSGGDHHLQLTHGIRLQAGYSSFRTKSIVDVDDDHLLACLGHRSFGLLFLLFLPLPSLIPIAISLSVPSSITVISTVVPVPAIVAISMSLR